MDLFCGTKRLEAGVFKLPGAEKGARSWELRASELAMILDGNRCVEAGAGAALRTPGRMKGASRRAKALRREISVLSQTKNYPRGL